jgi:PAS domain S-box-containing protein
MTALLFFALEYANPGLRTSRRNARVLSALVLFVTLVLATNDLHHLYWARLWFDGFVRFERGPLSLAVLGYTLLLPTLALLIFLRLVLRSRGILRGQALLLFAGNALPVLAFLLLTADINPIAPLDPIILMLNVTGLLFALAVYRFGMLGVVPIGRDTAVERMTDGLLILDAHDRIIDLNPAAQEALALTRSGAIGHAALQFLSSYPDLASILDEEGASEAEVHMNAAGQLRYYQAHVLPLVDRGGFKLGRLISLKDVTEQKRTQAQIVDQQRALATMAERERLARELHDSIGQTVGFLNAQAQAAREHLSRGETGTVDNYLARLVEVAQNADADIRESIMALRSTAMLEQGLVPALDKFLRQFGTTYDLRTELTAGGELKDLALETTVELDLLRIIQEALANARKHAHARSVTVRLAVQGDCLEMVVEDDGDGFDVAAATGASRQKFGLQMMRERAQKVGGNVAIDSAVGQGTRVRVEIPLTPSRPLQRRDAHASPISG